MTHELLLTPNVGTGALEDRDRIHFGALREAPRDRVLTEMERRGLDACVFGREANARYVSGVRRLWTAQSRPFVPTCIVVRESRHVQLLSFSASYEGIPEEIGPDDMYPVTWNPMNFVDRMSATPGLPDAERIGFDGLSPFFEMLLRQATPAAEYVGVEDMMRELRRRKTRDEIACIRTAVAIAESALYAAACEVRPGVTEQHLRAAFLDRMCALGTSQFAQQGVFTVIDPGAPLRWTTSERALDEASVVALAGGALWAGYEGSLARTWWCGRQHPPSAAARGLYARWRNVVDRVVDTCRPRRTGADLSAAYQAAGEGRPQMSIAYSVGLGHEGPLAGPPMSAELERAQAIEPGMTLAVRAFVAGDEGGFFGEDMVLVTDDAPERLTTLGHGPLAG
jgi:Xaa-Pro aminopeptidase